MNLNEPRVGDRLNFLRCERDGFVRIKNILHVRARCRCGTAVNVRASRWLNDRAIGCRACALKRNGKRMGLLTAIALKQKAGRAAMEAMKRKVAPGGTPAEVAEAMSKRSKLQMHRRWHVGRNQINPDCEFCDASVEAIAA
jgi:hypothetical protein